MTIAGDRIRELVASLEADLAQAITERDTAQDAYGVAEAEIARLRAELDACQGPTITELVGGFSSRDAMAPAAWRELVDVWHPWLYHRDAAAAGSGAPVVTTAWDQAESAEAAGGPRFVGRQGFGRFDAGWLKTRTGTVAITDPPGGGSATSMGTFDVGQWWEGAFRGEVRLYELALAEQWDGLLARTTFAQPMTIHAEPFLRQLASTDTRNALRTAGWEQEVERWAWAGMLADHAEAWKVTRTSLHLNPGQTYRDGVFDSSDMAWTIEATELARAALGDRLVIGNNSLDRDRAEGIYAALYAYMRDLRDQGVPLVFQTANLGLFRDRAELLWALDYAIDAGAHLVELPVGFEKLVTAADLEPRRDALVANIAA